MFPHLKRHKLISKFCLGILLFSIIVGIRITHPRLVAAQSSTLLDSDISSLRQRVSQLESEVRRLRQPAIGQPSRIKPKPLDLPPQVVDGELIGRSDPMYKRLATLVIELKQQVKDLENRLAQVEQKVE